MFNAVLEIKELGFVYSDGIRALDGVSLSLAPHEKLAIVGRNGSGKSTLLRHIAGCSAPQSGSVLLGGTAAAPERLREAVGLIFQDPDDQLFMPSVLEDAAFGLAARGADIGSAKSLAMSILAELGIERLAERPPHKLSGGEKRLAALAGILVMKPEILVLDEPSAGLDPHSRRRVINILRGTDMPMIIASHDLDMVLDICSRCVILKDGAAIAEGTLPDILTDGEFMERCGLELPLRYQQTYP